MGDFCASTFLKLKIQNYLNYFILRDNIILLISELTISSILINNHTLDSFLEIDHFMPGGKFIQFSAHPLINRSDLLD